MRQNKQREAARRAQAALLAKKAKAREVEKRRRDRERLLDQKRRERERKRAALQAEAARRAKEKERARIEAQKAAEKTAARKAREAEAQAREAKRAAERLAREQERLRLRAEKEAEREELRRQKEEERARREAEREAYRKAKEAERERIRAAKEAARRALEGRVAEATRNANKLGTGRATTTRFYSPRAIPNQSGTTRRLPSESGISPTLHTPTPPAEPSPRLTPAPEAEPTGSSPIASAPDQKHDSSPAERGQPLPESIEERFASIVERLKAVSEGFRRDYAETLDMSWIHHDSALEGVVYTFQELKSAIDPGLPVISDSSLQPVVEEIRRHKAAIELVRELGERKRAAITVDVIKKIYITLHPEEGDIKTVKYRRDIPQHRLYFHEYCHPEKIPYKVRQVVDWLNGPEPKKLKSPIRVATRVHYELLRVFPFQTDSGKVARLLMNLLLLRSGYPPAIIHSTERQRYYESLKGALPQLVQMVTESLLNALVSIEKLLDENDARLRGGT